MTQIEAWAILVQTGYPGGAGGAGRAHYLGVVSVPDHYDIYIYVIYNAMNTDSARISPFFRLLFRLSPMNYDMSVFMSTFAHIRDNIML